MRDRTRVAWVLCLLAVVVACDAEQPQQIGGQTVQVSFDASTAVPLFDVWERYVDANGDGVPDQFDSAGRPIVPPVQVQCRRVVQGGSLLTGTPTSIPWSFSVEILLLEDGETEPVRLTSTDALDAGFNLAPYDTTRFLGQTAPPCTAPEVCTPLGRLSSANRIVLQSTYEDQTRGSVTIGGQVFFLFTCPGVDFGDPVLGGTTADPEQAPFTLDLNRGDTILVRARKAQFALGNLEVTSEPILNSRITVGGRPVSNAIGTQSSDSSPGSGLSYSYTLQ